MLGLCVSNFLIKILIKIPYCIIPNHATLGAWRGLNPTHFECVGANPASAESAGWLKMMQQKLVLFLVALWVF